MKEVRYILIDSKGNDRIFRSEGEAIQAFSLEMELYNNTRGAEKDYLYEPELIEEILVESYYNLEYEEWQE